MSIRVEQLCHIYNEGLPHETKALSDVSFEIKSGIFCGIIGHTGSGKSSLIQHLNGLLKPKSGKIFIDGEEITAEGFPLRNIRRKVGLVFQYPEYQLFEETVLKDVAFGPLNLGFSQEEALEQAKQALELVGLPWEEFGERSPFDLSGGQKRRAAIAGVLAMKPRILILDEPTAGLDPQSHREILAMIRKIQETEGITILLVSHNMRDIAALSDQILVMDQGRIALQGTPKEVFSQGETLRKLGLDLPPAAAFAEELKNKGCALEELPLTIEEAEETILRWLKHKN
ncbi:MAG: energy-coupling factor transporter ATPase [Clostridiales bacterium]|nr:energy-coupling factor transporter ATPase [Clostridiales bacterium]